MIRAAVTLALDSAMPALIEELTERVMIAVRQHLVNAPAPARKSEPEPAAEAAAAGSTKE
jgi:hypothetical protein